MIRPSLLKQLALSLLGTLLVFLQGGVAATVETRSIESASMHKTILATLVTPDSYAKSKATYPVVYLLDGYGGSHSRWVRETPVAELADQHGLIVVCLDGALDSWYFDAPGDPNYCYETFVSKEVVSFVDQNYRTLASPKGRAITGLSMGGHGAMFLSLRHKDVFGAAGSMSGGLDIRPFPKNWNIAQRLGTIEEHPERWDAMTVINNISNLKNGELAITVDCGSQDFFLAVNRAFHEALTKAGIDHDYVERPGGHDWAYWKNSIRYQMLYFHLFFVKNQPASTL